MYLSDGVSGLVHGLGVCISMWLSGSVYLVAGRCSPSSSPTSSTMVSHTVYLTPQEATRSPGDLIPIYYLSRCPTNLVGFFVCSLPVTPLVMTVRSGTSSASVVICTMDPSTM